MIEAEVVYEWVSVKFSVSAVNRAVNERRLECPAVSRSQWEEMKHDTREPVKAPAHPLPENTSARPPGNLQLTLTHARHTRTARHGSGRAGETLPQEPETDREPPQNSRTCTEFGPRAVRASRYRHRQDGQTFGVPLHRDRRLGVRASAGVQR